MNRAKVKVRDRFTRRPTGRVVAVAVLVVLAAVVGELVLLARGSEPEEPESVVEVSTEPVKAQPVEPAARPTQVVAFADGCASAECHGPMGDRPYVHTTFQDHACELCHAPDTGGHVYPLLASAEDTCTACHETGADHTFQHKAMSEEACLACHDPHGSASPALLIAASIEDTCLNCHPRDRGAVAHEPYATDQCTACHAQHGANNPMLLIGGAGEDHCRTCHTPLVNAMDEGTYTHREAEGECLGCHNAHTSHNAGLLPAKPRDLCVTCHEDVGSEVAGATVSHESVLTGEQCVSCHDPHTSEHPSMLRDTQEHVCLSCHDKPVEAADGREVASVEAELAGAALVHGAVRIGDCSACHSVHGGTHAQLLRSVNTKVFVGEYDRLNYALCFSCHDRKLAEHPYATLFRDGDENLHAVHLQADGSSGGCADCHSVHAGDLPRLIVETVQYQGSDWETPMQFQLTETGGSCAPGCHQPMSYSRAPGGARGQTDGGSP